MKGNKMKGRRIDGSCKRGKGREKREKGKTEGDWDTCPIVDGWEKIW
jgi:hypothetical protein